MAQTLRDIDQLFEDNPRVSRDVIDVQSDGDQHIVVDRRETEEEITPSQKIFKKFMDPDRKAADIPLPAPTPSAGPLLKLKPKKKGPPKKRGRKIKSAEEKMAELLSSAPRATSTPAKGSKVPDAPLQNVSNVSGRLSLLVWVFYQLSFFFIYEN